MSLLFIFAMSDKKQKIKVFAIPKGFGLFEVNLLETSRRGLLVFERKNPKRLR